MHRYPLPDLPATAWKNGGGVSREMACAPEGSDPFDWRVSVATIEADGPFSRFNGIGRTITDQVFSPHPGASLVVALWSPDQ